MSEERTQYTVHPDIAIRLEVAERHIKHLTSTIDGMTMVMGRHADTITEQAKRIERIAEEKAQAIAQLECASARIAELEADVARKNGALHACDQTIAALEARLAAIPLPSMERHIMGIEQACDYHAIIEYFFPDEVTA